MSALFSIVIPVFNAAGRLEQCLESVLRQSFGGWQAVAVDDGSDDGCAQICDSFAARDSRIKVIHTENRGVSAARNAGIAACEGEYVMFLDSDDMLLSGALEQLSRVCRNNVPTAPDVVIFDYAKINENEAGKIGEIKPVLHEQFPPEGAVSARRALAWLFEDRYCWNVWQAAFRRDLLVSLNDSQTVEQSRLQSNLRQSERCSYVFDENIRVAEDLLMFVRALIAVDNKAGDNGEERKKSRSVIFFPKPLYAYISVSDSVMNKTLTDSAKQTAAARDVIEVESRLEKIMAENPDEASEKYHFHAFHIFFSWAVRICATKSTKQKKSAEQAAAKRTASDLKRLALRVCPPFKQLNLRDKIKYFVFVSGLYKIRTVSAVFNRRSLER